MSYNQKSHFKPLSDIFSVFDAPFPTMSLSTAKYPPINISSPVEENGVETYFIEYALAGFSRDEINIESERKVHQGQSYNVVSVTASKSDKGKVDYLKHGIAYRDVNHSTILSNQDVILNAKYENGILTVFIKRENEIEKGTSIPIE